MNKKENIINKNKYMLKKVEWRLQASVSKCIWFLKFCELSFKYLVWVNKERCKGVSLDYLEYTA